MKKLTPLKGVLKRVPHSTGTKKNSAALFGGMSDGVVKNIHILVARPKEVPKGDEYEVSC